MPNLSPNESRVRDAMPVTTAEICEILDVSPSYARTIVYDMKEKGLQIGRNDDGEYYIKEEPSVDTSARRRSADATPKATKTRETKDFLREMERRLAEQLSGSEPAIAENARLTETGVTGIFHRTDDHFGQKETDEYGNVIASSDLTEARVGDYFDEGIHAVEGWAEMGHTVDGVVVLFGGDCVTGENTYDGQSHEIDANIKEQIDRASETYLRQIKKLAARFPAVKVVCQAGNHGELRYNNASAEANADDIVYLILDKMVREADLDNVTFIQSTSTYFVNFSIRDWDAHLRHGHDASLEHIGTNTAKQRWQSWLLDHGFDVAFRGHYHELKEEPIHGIPVVMGGTAIPQTDFEESRALSGRAIGAVHGATDEYVLKYTHRIPFE